MLQLVYVRLNRVQSFGFATILLFERAVPRVERSHHNDDDDGGTVGDLDHVGADDGDGDCGDGVCDMSACTDLFCVY